MCLTMQISSSVFHATAHFVDQGFPVECCTATVLTKNKSDNEPLENNINLVKKMSKYKKLRRIMIKNEAKPTKIGKTEQKSWKKEM